MPRVIECADMAPLSLGEVVQSLNDDDFDPEDLDSFAAAGPLLKGLAANRSFLGDIALAELKDRCRAQSRVNGYSAQVVMLHRASEKYFIRANFWPSPRDSVFKTSGPAPFFYEVPHDHSFSFLTVGYLGPGYWSDYYEYDYGEVAGYPGEKVDLRFIERSRLDQGKVMLYRAHLDVHNQLPPDAMSVSINVMEASPRQPMLSQYLFDVQKCEVAGVLTHSATEALLALAANSESGNARDLVADFAARHPCDRIRFAAIAELAAVAPDVSGQLHQLEAGARSSNLYVATMSAREIERVTRGRAWIDRAPLSRA